MTKSLAWSFKQVIWVWQVSAVIESEVYMVAVGVDVTEVLRHLLRPNAIADGPLFGPRYLYYIWVYVDDQFTNKAGKLLGFGS